MANLFFIVTTIALSVAAHAGPQTQMVPASEVQFLPLNPARGDASPRAGALWGDLRKDVPSGALIRFADGFSSPPHIHNITYRGIVISGSIHNDDPDAKNLWMGPGSFWTQPAGESHITAAGPGGEATAFLEIFEGPYLVQPSDEAFDNGERPVNLDARNVVWLDASDVDWIEQPGMSTGAPRTKVAFLWGIPGDGQRNGTLLKLPAGSSGELRGNGAWLRAVVIQGQVQAGDVGEDDISLLNAGSYFGSNNSRPRVVNCTAENDCSIYISTKGRYEYSPL